MSNTLVLGGTRSSKSRWAERYACDPKAPNAQQRFAPNSYNG